MGLRFDPMGGGQFQQAIKQIVEAERQPVRQIEARKGREEAKLKLFQEFKSKFSGIDKTLSEFTNFKRFRELKTDLGEAAEYLGLTFDKERAEPGTYTIQVDQLAKRSSVISNGFSDPDEPNLGLGFIVFELPNGETQEIFVDNDESSLRNVAALINKSGNSAVQASVLKDSSDMEQPWKLIMTAKKDGLDDEVHFPELYFLDGYEDIWFSDNQDAENAVIQVDGFEIETDSNHIKDFLTGINLHLKQAAPDRPFTITIGEDYQKISGKVKNLVDQVNSILQFVNDQNKIDEKTDTRTTFAGDTGLQTVEYRLRNLMHEGFPVGDFNDVDSIRWMFATELGIEFNKNGLLDFKEEKFTKIMEDDFQGVADAITGEHGLASQLKSVITGYTRIGTGMLALREQGLRSRIKKLDEDISNKEARIEQRQQRLVEQFSRLQSSLANLQRQSAYLSATLPGGGGGNLVSQLLG